MLDVSGMRISLLLLKNMEDVGSGKRIEELSCKDGDIIVGSGDETSELSITELLCSEGVGRTLLNDGENVDRVRVDEGRSSILEGIMKERVGSVGVEVGIMDSVRTGRDVSCDSRENIIDTMGIDDNTNSGTSTVPLGDDC